MTLRRGWDATIWLHSAGRTSAGVIALLDVRCGVGSLSPIIADTRDAKMIWIERNAF
jgi:hypothetical protein